VIEAAAAIGGKGGSGRNPDGEWLAITPYTEKNLMIALATSSLTSA
jgi:hypothetical protein